MKISQVVKLLEMIKEMDGDVEVNVFDPDKLAEGHGVEIEAFLTLSAMADGSKTVIFTDKETAMGGDTEVDETCE